MRGSRSDFGFVPWYIYSWRVGLHSLFHGKCNREVLLRFLEPIAFYRCIEVPWVERALRPWTQKGMRVLDVGSPKFIGLYLAQDFGTNVWCTDILDSALEDYRRFSAALPRARHLLSFETHDARSMSYRNDTFDAIYSVSVLEHIPGEGDHLAIREMERVLKPGGVLAITVPYRTGYAEGFVRRSVYERQYEGGEPVHWSRYYDLAALRDRLVSQLEASHLEMATLFQHRPASYVAFYSTPKPLRALRFLTNPIHAKLGFRRLCEGKDTLLKLWDHLPKAASSLLYGERIEEIERKAQPFGVACLAFRKVRGKGAE